MTTEHTAGSPFGTGDVVFTFSYETLDDARERGMMRPPDRILSTLMARPDVRRLLIANPHRSIASTARRMLRGGSTPLDDSSHRLITPVRARRDDPTGPAGIAATYAAYDKKLSRASRRLGQHRPDVITTHPLVAGFSPLDWAGQTLYFGRDDWASFPGRSDYWPAYREAYRRIAKSGQPVAAVSAAIIERIAPTGPHLVVPNGVEPDEWLTPLPDAPPWLEAIPAPRAVYVGTLDTRIDVDAIGLLARARPEVSIVLVGPAPDPELLNPIRSLTNVHVHPTVGRRELVATLRNSQVSLVAHNRTPLTEAMSPLKVYEYLAAGLPVLSIDIEPVRGLDPAIMVVPAASDFVDVIDAAIAHGPLTESRRVAFVQDNSWTSRHDRMFELLRR